MTRGARNQTDSVTQKHGRVPQETSLSLSGHVMLASDVPARDSLCKSDTHTHTQSGCISCSRFTWKTLQRRPGKSWRALEEWSAERLSFSPEEQNRGGGGGGRLEPIQSLFITEHTHTLHLKHQEDEEEVQSLYFRLQALLWGLVFIMETSSKGVTKLKAKRC